MAELVKVSILKKDAYLLKEGPKAVEISCAQGRIDQMFWAVPVMQNEMVVDYSRVLADAASKPTSDSIRIIAYTANGAYYWIIVPDNATEAYLTDACNACCGSSPDISAQTIPVPLHESCPCIDASGNYVWNWPMPYNPATRNIVITAATFDGVAGTPTANPSGYANAAAVLTFVQTNWGAYGTWSLSGTVLTLSSTTTKCAAMDLDLVPGTYCYSLPASASRTIDGVVIGGNVALFQDGAITVSATAPQGLAYALAKILIGNVSVVSGAPYKLSYTGLQVPGAFYYNGAALGTGDTFSSGVCTWVFPFTIPADIGGQNYHVTQASFNGVVAVPSITGTNFADIATMLTWLNANWGAYGTWTSTSGTNLTLTSTTTHTVTNLTVTQS